MVQRIDNRNSITYKKRLPSPVHKDFLTFWECSANRKDSQIFTNSFCAFDDHVKQYNDGETFSPGAVTFDDWAPFAKTLCERYNLKPLRQYLNDEHRRFMGEIGIEKNRTTLILGLIHIKKSIKQKFNYSQAIDISQFPMKRRKRVKYLAYDVIQYIACSFNNLLIIDSIQIFNFITKLSTFSLKGNNDISTLLWQHDILCPNPQHTYSRQLSFKFAFIKSGNYYLAKPFSLCEIYVMERKQEWLLNISFLYHIKTFIEIRVDNNEDTFNNPYFMPCAAEYMNKKKFRRLALFSRICIGMTRDRTSNQTIEGTFNVDKNHPIGLKRNLRIHEYVRQTIKYQKYQIQHYFQECIEARNIALKQELDETRKSKIVLSDREKEIHEKFDKLIRIKYEGDYNRARIKKNWDSFYADSDVPEIHVQQNTSN